MQDVYVVAALRSPVGKARGIFGCTRPDDLLSDVLKNLMQSLPQVPTEKIEDVIIGCAMPEAEQGMNVARVALLLAGFPDNVPGVTVNRFCASGLQAISMAAERIALGQADVMVAGGVESMTYVPMGGYHFAANPAYFQKEQNKDIAFNMGITAEKVAQKWKISREAQDIFAFESHQKALKAIQDNLFAKEITPIMVSQDKPDLQTQRIVTVQKEVKQDEGPRADTNLIALSKLRTVFSAKGTVTAGNSSQISDGAAALLLVSEAALKAYNLTPLARYRGFAVEGVAPEYMGIGPIKAIPKVLKHTGVSLNQIDWIELNEAFAAQSLAVIQELGLDNTKVNPCGGAIALGHPLGATGAILTTKMIHGARRTQGKYGLVTMCIGTGMGAAGVFELC